MPFHSKSTIRIKYRESESESDPYYKNAVIRREIVPFASVETINSTVTWNQCKIIRMTQYNILSRLWSEEKEILYRHRRSSMFELCLPRRAWNHKKLWAVGNPELKYGCQCSKQVYQLDISWMRGAAEMIIEDYLRGYGHETWAVKTNLCFATLCTSNLHQANCCGYVRVALQVCSFWKATKRMSGSCKALNDWIKEKQELPFPLRDRSALAVHGSFCKNIRVFHW